MSSSSQILAPEARPETAALPATGTPPVSVPPAVVPDEATVISKPGQFSGGSGNGDGQGTVVPAPSHEFSKLLAGERLGHYELLEFAGGGGMGAVFRARDLTLNREVAIKVLARNQATDEETLKRFKNEAQSAARLDHENIARVHYVGEDRGLHYIVFEFIEGVNIRQMVEKQGPLPLEQAISYTLQISDALAHAAGRDVVHRDIKPSNILITAQGKAKLVDMGLARLHGMQAPGEDLTASGVTLGTFDYISPEQARDPRAADVRSDIYSLGCTFYFMLTARPPFPEGTVLQKLLQHNSDDPIDPREYNPDLPDAVTTVLRKMLAKEPHRRYQTPAELIADLLLLAERVGIQRSEVRLSMKWDSRRGDDVSPWARHLPWIVPIAALALVVLGLEFFDRFSDDGRNVGYDQGRPVDPAAGRPAPNNPAASIPGSSAVAPAAATIATLPSPIATGTTPSPNSNDNATSNTGATGVGTSQVAGSTAIVEPPTVGTSAAAERKLPPQRDGVLIVCDTPDGEGRFTNLRTACFSAKNGDVVELCYDGPRVERPLVLNNVKLTIRAGEGYRPAVRFRPADSAIPNQPHAMMSVVGGHLSLVGVEVGFDVPTPQEVPADRWSLFELQGAEFLGLERSVVTIANAGLGGRAYHANVAVVGTSPPPGAGAKMMNMPMEAAADQRPVPPTEVRFENCTVRGEATLLRAADLQSVSLQWNDGLLAVSESAISVSGGQMQPRDTAVRVEFAHLTAVTGGEFIRVTDDFDAPFLPEISVACSDSILIAAGGAPLVDYDGIDVRNDFLNVFQWGAERVFYDGFSAEAFWRLTSGDEVSQMLTFDDWRAQWGSLREVQTTWNEVRWRFPLPSPLNFHSVRPDDFQLDAAAGSPAVGGASDGGDVGANLTLAAGPTTTVVRGDDDSLRGRP